MAAVVASSGRLCSASSRHAQCGRSSRHSLVTSARAWSSSPAGSAAAGRNVRPVARSASAVLAGVQSSSESPCEDFMVNIRNTTMLTGSLGQPLSKEEQRSLLKCLDSARLGVDSCLIDGLTGLYDHLMAYIEEVSATQEDDLELVRRAWSFAWSATANTPSMWILYSTAPLTVRRSGAAIGRVALFWSPEVPLTARFHLDYGTPCHLLPSSYGSPAVQRVYGHLPIPRHSPG